MPANSPPTRVTNVIIGSVPLNSNGNIDWSVLPPSMRMVPISFVISGRPQPGQIYNIPILQDLTLPSNLAGSSIFTNILPTVNANFKINLISSNSNITVANITKTSLNQYDAIFIGQQTNVNLALGDVIQLVAPSVQDVTMAEIGISILLYRI